MKVGFKRNCKVSPPSLAYCCCLSLLPSFLPCFILCHRKDFSHVYSAALRGNITSLASRALQTAAGRTASPSTAKFFLSITLKRYLCQYIISAGKQAKHLSHLISQFYSAIQPRQLSLETDTKLKSEYVS